jgi:hypothetical protein
LRDAGGERNQNSSHPTHSGTKPRSCTLASRVLYFACNKKRSDNQLQLQVDFHWYLLASVGVSCILLDLHRNASLPQRLLVSFVLYGQGPRNKVRVISKTLVKPRTTERESPLHQFFPSCVAHADTISHQIDESDPPERGRDSRRDGADDRSEKTAATCLTGRTGVTTSCREACQTAVPYDRTKRTATTVRGTSA